LQQKQKLDLFSFDLFCLIHVLLSLIDFIFCFFLHFATYCDPWLGHPSNLERISHLYTMNSEQLKLAARKLKKIFLSVEGYFQAIQPDAIHR